MTVLDACGRWLPHWVMPHVPSLVPDRPRPVPGDACAALRKPGGLAPSGAAARLGSLDAETIAGDAEAPIHPTARSGFYCGLCRPNLPRKNVTYGVLLLREDIRDPVLRAERGRLGKVPRSRLGASADNASDGEQLGWQMASVWLGAQTWWACTRSDAPDVAIRQALEHWWRAVRLETRAQWRTECSAGSGQGHDRSQWTAIIGGIAAMLAASVGTTLEPRLGLNAATQCNQSRRRVLMSNEPVPRARWPSSRNAQCRE